MERFTSCQHDSCRGGRIISDSWITTDIYFHQHYYVEIKVQLFSPFSSSITSFIIIKNLIDSLKLRNSSQFGEIHIIRFSIVDIWSTSPFTRAGVFYIFKAHVSIRLSWMLRFRCTKVSTDISLPCQWERDQYFRRSSLIWWLIVTIFKTIYFNKMGYKFISFLVHWCKI